ncbi:DUF5666 domain-containing protein [Nocardia sp. CS682]|uniref:DUF5666 domain-containing protein n=1 Tax=Nocardia sp. CS682 TaxID=1047172 RepID=UPI001074C8B3|nr:DUF5666 domain-containing protein [Nocardia sp. CS682]QBS41912.1 hypothetical protein DMB37_19035 [Nocardia sp. CS682]
MTNPNDPWGQRPEDAPTEHLAGKSGFEQPQHTTDYSEAYGSGAPSAYPATEQFEPWSAPPPNATRAFPPHDNQWGAYENTYGDQWSGAAPPPGGPVPPGYGMQPSDQLPPEPPRRNTGLWIALGLGVIALVAVVGVVAGVVLAGKDSGSDTAASTSAFPTANRPTPGTPRSGQPAPSGIPSVPGLGNIDDLGATMGTITANDGGTLTVSTLLGSTVSVRTDANTQVISMSGTKVSDLPTGDIVLIQGEKAADGSIHAKVIISTALPGGVR